MRPGTRILVVEDNRSIAKFVELELRHRDFGVRCAHDGQEALEQLEKFRPELVVLDIMLPGLDGVGVLTRIRQRGNRAPVIMLALRHRRAAGPNPGAPAPDGGRRATARWRPGGRHGRPRSQARRAGDRAHLPRVRATRVHGEKPRRVLSRDFLLDRVWNQEFGIPTNVVDVYVGYLRKKIDTEGEPKLIHTVRGAGYALKER